MRLSSAFVLVLICTPAAVLAVVETANAEDPELLIEAGVNVPVAPEGSPDKLRFTVPENPFWAAIVAL